MEEKLKQGEGFLPEEERRRLEQSFRDGQRDLQRSQNEFMEDLNLRRNERLGDLQRLFLTEIQAYGQAQNYRPADGRRVHPRERQVSTSLSRSCRSCSGATRAAEDGARPAWP
jgi:hypothetical protein